MDSNGCGATPSASRSPTSPTNPCGPDAFFRALADGLLAILIAPACAACRQLLLQPTRGPVCATCWNGIRVFTPPIGHSRENPLRSAIRRSCAIGPYEGSLRAIVHALKYGRRRSIARELGGRMRDGGERVLAGASAVVPVPLHWRRRRRRGFNQAADLAAALGIPVVHALKRVRATSSQTGLAASQRRANVRGAFAMRRRTDVRGLSIVLVDDVATTGATLEGCARVLLAAGASEVRAITAARVASGPSV
jgi:ComF family protein